MPGDITNGPDHTATEAVVNALVTLRQKPCLKHFSFGKTLALQVVAQLVPGLGCVSNTEGYSGGLVEAALTYEFAPFGGAWGGKLGDEKLCRSRVCGQNARAIARIAGLSATLFIVQLKVDARCETLDRLREREVIDLLQERVDVATLAATEAVVVTHLRANVEAG